MMKNRQQKKLARMGAATFAVMLLPLASSAADTPVAPPVSAQAAAEAKAYRDKGGKDFDQGNYQEAYEAFQRMESAEKVVTLGLFETQSVELSAEDTDASLRLESTPADASLRIEGRDVGKTPWEGRLPLGEHAVEVRSKGYFVGKQRVVLERRRQREVSVSLERVPEPPGFWTGRNVGTTAGLGVGLIGLGFFGVAGGLALRNASELKDVCQERVCPGGKGEQLAETQTLGNAALAGMIVGGIGMAAGSAVWFFAAPKEQKRETWERAGLGVKLGLGGVAVEGSF